MAYIIDKDWDNSINNKGLKKLSHRLRECCNKTPLVERKFSEGDGFNWESEHPYFTIVCLECEIMSINEVLKECSDDWNNEKYLIG